MPAATDTIVAVSSPPGRSLRGLVRVSGPQTRNILNHLCTPKPGPDSSRGRGLPPRTLTACNLKLSSATNLPVLAAYFPGSRTYTGQDMLEIQCPGNPALLDRIVQAVTACDPKITRLAEPGEFTFRAFLAGKLDLTQAEGVAATIAAAGDAELQAATMLRRGKLGSFAGNLVDQLANQLALVEAGIDFVDQDDVVPIAPAALAANLMKISRELDDLLAHSRSWSEIEALPRVVLVGAPSTGKSTLFNALLGRERAVISPIPGTTRDILAEPLTLPDRTEVMLVDIAGLDTPMGGLDEQVQAAVRSAIDRADVILLINDGTLPALPLGEGGPLADRVRGLAAGEIVRVSESSPFANPLTPALSQEERGPDLPHIRVRTKADLPAAHNSGLPVSAVTGAGLDELRRQITQAIGDRGVSLSAQMLVLQPRHESALRAAAEHLALTRDLLHPQLARRSIEHVELVAGSLRQALDELACLGGRMTPDDVIGRVFATFCVGK